VLALNKINNVQECENFVFATQTEFVLQITKHENQISLVHWQINFGWLLNKRSGVALASHSLLRNSLPPVVATEGRRYRILELVKTYLPMH
jgi:hypothetical protein